MNTPQKHFPTELKESVARRYLSTNASLKTLAEEIGSSTWSVRAWVREYQAQGTVGKRRKKPPAARPDQRSPKEKLHLLFLLKGMSDEERGEYLRREGLHDGDIERWEREAVAGLRGEETPTQQQRIRQLERESAHHKKRLREAEALLVLQKKVQALWVAEDDDTNET